MIEMEVCANSVTSAIAAERGGAVRIELCDNLSEGGTTPSYGQIKLTRESVKIKVYPIIRPRGGDFMYSDLEFAVMKQDIMMCKSLHCDGVVIGILRSDGSIDQQRCAELVELARPMKVTFHRAFDMSSNLGQALEDIIELDCERILTSGGASTAFKGAERIKDLIDQAAGRIEIMPGAGVRTENISEIICITGAKSFHATAKLPVKSHMRYQRTELIMGDAGNEFGVERTDVNIVRDLIHLANEATLRSL